MTAVFTTIAFVIICMIGIAVGRLEQRIRKLERRHHHADPETPLREGWHNE